MVVNYRVHRYIFQPWKCMDKWAGRPCTACVCEFASRNSDPHLWLERPCGNRDETNQIHVLELHISLTDFPFLINGFIHSTSLNSDCEPRMMWISMRDVKTYSHGFEVLVKLLCDIVCQLATSYPGPVFRPAERGNL